MPYRLTKLYTRQGDAGWTHLGDKKIAKDDILIEVLGSLDELNAALGMIVAYPLQDKTILEQLTKIQNELFDIGGELVVPAHPKITKNHIIRLEREIDHWNKTLPPLKEFLLPGGNLPSATTHLARTICRRAERGLAKLHLQVPLDNPFLLAYINRLSDWLFALTRILMRETEEEEQLWER